MSEANERRTVQLFGLSGANAVLTACAACNDFLNYNKMKHKHISFPEYKAMATVDKDCPQEVIDALKEMCRIAYYNLKKPLNQKEPEAVHGNEAEKEGCNHNWIRGYRVFKCSKCGKMMKTGIDCI